jgi:hypothetical protein
MAAAADRNNQIVIFREPDASYDVRCAYTTRNHCRVAVDHGIKDFSRLVVIGVIAGDDTSAHRSSQVHKVCFR